MQAEIDNFEREALAWRAGGGLGDDFRPFRLQHGTYGQRQADSQMMRIKVPHGTHDARPAPRHRRRAPRRYTPRKLGHVTTRQAIQLHFVMLEDAPKVMRRLAEVGITTREACGHTVRNITADPLTGIADDCVFDVTPYAEAAMRYFLRNTVNQKLPRKFKITYSASEADRGMIPIHDIGLMAVERDGEQGFRVSVGGGLGAAPRVADVLVDFIPVREQLRTIEAVIRVWDRLGERRNKNKARIKFLIAKLGIDEFRRLYEAELATLPPADAEQYREPDFTLLEEAPAYGSYASRNGGATQPREGFEVWRRTNALKQKQAPYYTVYVLLPIGDATATRCTRSPRSRASTPAATSAPRRRRTSCCAGCTRTTCPRSTRELADIGLAEDRRGDDLRRHDLPRRRHLQHRRHVVEGARHRAARRGSWRATASTATRSINELKIKISGCPNSCGQHHVADIGFYGMAIRSGERQMPAFQLMLGGNAQGEGRLAQDHDEDARAAHPRRRREAASTRTSPSAATARSSRRWSARVGTPHVQELLAEYKIVPQFNEGPDGVRRLGPDQVLHARRHGRRRVRRLSRGERDSDEVSDAGSAGHQPATTIADADLDSRVGRARGQDAAGDPALGRRASTSPA